MKAVNLALNFEDLEEKLKQYACGVVDKKLTKLKNRSWVLFPWVRAWLLMRKFKYIEKTFYDFSCIDPKALQKIKDNA